MFHRSGDRELFNLESDISETQDITSANGEVAEQMTSLMQDYIDRGRSTPGDPQKNEFDLSLTFGQAKNKQN